MFIPSPLPSDGEAYGCLLQSATMVTLVNVGGFLTQCSLAFELQAAIFPTGCSEVAYIILVFTNRALSWAMAI